MKKKIFILLLSFFGTNGFSQNGPAPLIHVISFDALKKLQSEKELAWINPDGISEKIKIHVLPVPFTKKMQGLTKQFVRDNYGLDSIWLNPRMIVFHSMDLEDLQQSLELSSFLHDRIPASWGNLSKAGKLPNGAHFIIDRNGEIYCLSPPYFHDQTPNAFDEKDHQWLIRRHQDANPVAIGIENVTQRNGDFTDLTAEQITANAKLTRWLLAFEGGRIEFIASHHQFNEDSQYEKFLAKFGLHHFQKDYRTRDRKDIGDANLSKIRDQINAHGFTVQLFFK